MVIPILYTFALLAAKMLAMKNILANGVAMMLAESLAGANRTSARVHAGARSIVPSGHFARKSFHAGARVGLHARGHYVTRGLRLAPACALPDARPLRERATLPTVFTAREKKGDATR